jgi:hypothetical protein
MFLSFSAAITGKWQRTLWQGSNLRTLQLSKVQMRRAPRKRTLRALLTSVLTITIFTWRQTCRLCTARHMLPKRGRPSTKDESAPSRFSAASRARGGSVVRKTAISELFRHVVG